MLDRLTYNNIKKHVKETSPDIVEMMPAGLTKMITYALAEINGKPLVVSGLVLDKSDVMGLFQPVLLLFLPLMKKSGLLWIRKDVVV